MTTISADISQSIFEFLHSELVTYLQRGSPRDKVGDGEEIEALLSLSLSLSIFLSLSLSLYLS